MNKSSNIILHIIDQGQKKSIHCQSGYNLLDILIMEGIHLRADCGRKGTCGKCKIKIIEGHLDRTTQDNILFTPIELQEGYRLACKAYPTSECTIQIQSGEEEDYEVVSDYKNKEILSSELVENEFGIGIDLGTTTIALSLVGRKSKKVYNTYTTINRQRAYGADVISRIQASNSGSLESLQQLVRQDLLEGIQKLIAKAGIRKEQVFCIAIAGNTTMGHLLMGYSCVTLGTYPFRPYQINKVEVAFYEIFSSKYLEIPVIIMPGISTFVGGDILAGLYYCGYHKLEKPCLLIDLGTNGEMAIGNRDKIFVTSTAAGPAFEGGNLSCGVGSVTGAISHVTIENNQVKYETIGEKEAVGICGTGIIDTISELLKCGWMDETGLLREDYFEEGFQLVDLRGTSNNSKQQYVEQTVEQSIKSVIITQKDIREFQFAKAAIRTGIETLIEQYGITYNDIDTVYLAGGFGYKIDIDKAVHIGLLPEEVKGKIKAIGNSSLAGALQYLTEDKADEILENLRSISEEIHLSNNDSFNERYLSYMYF